MPWRTGWVGHHCAWRWFVSSHETIVMLKSNPKVIQVDLARWVSHHFWGWTRKGDWSEGISTSLEPRKVCALACSCQRDIEDWQHGWMMGVTYQRCPTSWTRKRSWGWLLPHMEHGSKVGKDLRYILNQYVFIFPNKLLVQHFRTKLVPYDPATTSSPLERRDYQDNDDFLAYQGAWTSSSSWGCLLWPLQS